MSLWFVLKVNDQPIGSLQMRRQEHLDLTDKTAIADAISTYEVRHDGVDVGTVRHRYGDGAWELVRRALELVP